MNIQIKSTMSLVILGIFGLTFLCDAQASSERHKRRTDEQIEACIFEVGRHANYDNATRVVHRIAAFNQRNLVELEMKIETSVTLGIDDAVARTYRSSCVTGIMGDLVEFRIVAVPTDPDNNEE